MEELLRLQVQRRYSVDATVSSRISDVMALTPAQIEQDVSAVDPRSVPGNPVFVASGWSEHMLLRYLVTLDHCVKARVLDSCCGLGWGSHLVASVSATVTGVDLDGSSVEFCARRWGSSNVAFKMASVLELPFEDESFDVVLCMDAIEHFTPQDGERYLKELRRVCRSGGHLFGSSAFPETPRSAIRLRRTNPHHLHIYTREEMIRALARNFGEPLYVTRHYFHAMKS